MKNKILLALTAIIGVSTFVIGNTLKAAEAKRGVPNVVLAEDWLEEYKHQRKLDLENYVNLEDYPDVVQSEINNLLEWGYEQIDSAGSDWEIDYAYDCVTERIDEVIAQLNDPEANDLASYKQRKIDYINSKIDFDSYNDEELKEKIRHLYDECIANIEYADSKTTVDYFFYDFLNYLDIEVPTEPDDVNTLEDAVHWAYRFIEGTISSYPYAVYFGIDIDLLVKRTKDAIDEATTIEEVEEEIEKFKTKFAEFPTSESIAVNRLRGELLSAYDKYQEERMLLTEYEDRDDLLVYAYEDFYNQVMHAKKIEHLYAIYWEAIEILDQIMPLEPLNSGNGTLNPIDTKDKDAVTALAVVCSVEGLFILAGVAILVFKHLKKKKQLTVFNK